ncbi:hypothetical protein [Xenorhabdus indica]|uniref:hypothetical protein n=1 Tax=Xenorhabdus indica TaxID=333964 RepID=UPI001657370D|nr:hypothetical protein [Xenorhabdus indica]MBC8943965.1 hypothetical protein [Xenorhabdus indica]
MKISKFLLVSLFSFAGIASASPTLFQNNNFTNPTFDAGGGVIEIPITLLCQEGLLPKEDCEKLLK